MPLAGIASGARRIDVDPVPEAKNGGW